MLRLTGNKQSKLKLIMRKYLIALAMFVMPAASPAATAQNDSLRPQTNAAAKAAGRGTTTANTSGNEDEGIEAYSDTTGACADTTGGYAQDSLMSHSYSVNLNGIGLGNIFNEFPSIMSGMFGAALILLIIFVFPPIAILALLLYFIYKSRKQNIKPAGTAMQNGQPMPGQQLGQAAISDEQMWRKGIKNIFLGIGLMFLFGFMGFNTGIGIGFLVLFYGAGQAVTARTSASKRNGNDRQREANRQTTEEDGKQM